MNEKIAVALIAGSVAFATGLMANGPKFLCQTIGQFCEGEPAMDVQSTIHPDAIIVTDTLRVTGTIRDQLAVLINGRAYAMPWEGGVIETGNLAGHLREGENRLTLIAINHENGGSVNGVVESNGPDIPFSSTADSRGFTGIDTFVVVKR